MFVMFSVLVLFLETWAVDTEKASTNVTNAVEEPTQLDPEIPVSLLRGLPLVLLVLGVSRLSLGVCRPLKKRLLLSGKLPLISLLT